LHITTIRAENATVIEAYFFRPVGNMENAEEYLNYFIARSTRRQERRGDEATWSNAQL